MRRTKRRKRRMRVGVSLFMFFNALVVSFVPFRL